MARNFRKLYCTILTLLVTLMIPVVVMAAGKDIIILHTNDIHCGITDNLGIDKVAQYKKGKRVKLVKIQGLRRFSYAGIKERAQIVWR